MAEIPWTFLALAGLAFGSATWQAGPRTRREVERARREGRAPRLGPPVVARHLNRWGRIYLGISAGLAIAGGVAAAVHDHPSGSSLLVFGAALTGMLAPSVRAAETARAMGVTEFSTVREAARALPAEFSRVVPLVIAGWGIAGLAGVAAAVVWALLPGETLAGQPAPLVAAVLVAWTGWGIALWKWIRRDAGTDANA